MGANQSSTGNDNAKSDSSSTGNNPPQAGSKRLTYQESFDIRNRTPNFMMTKRYPVRRVSNSSGSDTDNTNRSSVCSRSTSRVKRNKSNIRPPLLLYRGRNNPEYNVRDLAKGSVFQRKLSNTQSYKKSESPPLAGGGGDGAGIPDSTNSSFDRTDEDESEEIVREIDMILNDTSSGDKPWYRDHSMRHNRKKYDGEEKKAKKKEADVTEDVEECRKISICSSNTSSTVSAIRIPAAQSGSASDEDIYSTKSLPTPSFYLYLAFNRNVNDNITEDEQPCDMKKSKSIEVLDAPDYFFLNYDSDHEALNEDRNDGNNELENTNK